MPRPCEHESGPIPDMQVSAHDTIMKSTTHENLRSVSVSIAETFGNDTTSSELASSLRKLFPTADFLRVSMRYGSGLFVTDNLLHQGRCMTSLVSFRNSLSAECMDLGGLVLLSVPEAYGLEHRVGSRSSIAAVPAVAHGQAIGAIIVGASENEMEETVLDDMHALAESLGDVLELVGQSNNSYMSDLLALREQDSEFFGAEEALQDLPMSVSCSFGSFREAKKLELPSVPQEEHGNKTPLECVPEKEIFDEQEEQVTNVCGEEEFTKESSSTYCGGHENVFQYPEKPQASPIPDAIGVRAFGISTVYILATIILMAIKSERGFGVISLIPLLASMMALASSGMSLMGPKNNWLGSNADVFMAGFCVLNFLLSTIDAFSADDDVASLKHKLLQSMVVFESSLLLCLARRPVSYGAHVAACASLTLAMVMNA